MGKYRTSYLLAGAVVFGLILRVVLPWSFIFANGHINFSGVDSYSHMLTMRDNLSFPSNLFSSHLYDYSVVTLVRLLSLGRPTVSFLEHMAVFVPPAIAGLTILMVFATAHAIFSKRIGLIAAFLVAVLPGEYLGRSILGAVDHHFVEAFMMSLGFLLLIQFMKIEKWHRRKISYLGGIVLACYIYYSVWFHLTLGAIENIGNESLTFTLTSEAAHGWSNYLVFLHILLSLGLVCPAYRFGGRFKIILVGWLLVLIGATLYQERFDYCLTVPMVIMLAVLLEKVYFSLRENLCFRKLLSLSVCLVVLAMMTFPFYFNLSKQLYYTPPSDWYDALTWLEGNTSQDAQIVAWWDYGYWIEYIADRHALCDPGQEDVDVRRVAEFFNSNVPILFGGDQFYIMVDGATAFEFTEAIRLWAGNKITEYPMAQQLYQGPPPDGFKIVYSNKSVKIYKETS